MNEEWRPTHHPDYDVSNLGRVRSRAPLGRPDRASRRLRILKAAPDGKGYPKVDFYDGPVGGHRVHQLVAAAFLGPLPFGQEVRHKNDVRTDNRDTNLEYRTHLQNCQDAVTRNRLHMQKLTVRDVLQIRELYETGEYTQKEIGNLFGVLQPIISAIVCRTKWSHV